ncbi:hypothetical protein GCM10028895_28410 [Pontibacter rugosus]
MHVIASIATSKPKYIKSLYRFGKYVRLLSFFLIMSSQKSPVVNRTFNFIELDCTKAWFIGSGTYILMIA